MPAGAIGAIGAIGSAALSSRAASRNRRAQRRALEAAQVDLSPFSFRGPGGALGDIRPQSGVLTARLGPDLEGVRQGFTGLAGQSLGQVAQNAAGAPPDALVAALLRASQPIQVGQDNTLDIISSGLGDQFGRNLGTIQGLQSGGFQRGLQNTAFGGSRLQAALAGRGFEDVATDTLGLLRDQARPFEERAFSGLQDNLFSTGRLGTTGGALQTEAFARGLAQADIGRVLQSQEEARRVQSQTLQQALGLGRLGQTTASLEDTLLSSAFDRFTDTASLGADVTGQRFRQDTVNAELLRNSNQTNFLNVGQALTAGRALRGQDVSFLGDLLQGQSGLFDQSLQPLEFALRSAIARANTQNNSATNISSVVGGSNFNLGSGDEILAGLFRGIGQRSGGVASALQGLGSLFNRGGGNNANVLPADFGGKG